MRNKCHWLPPFPVRNLPDAYATPASPSADPPLPISSTSSFRRVRPLGDTSSRGRWRRPGRTRTQPCVRAGAGRTDGGCQRRRGRQGERGGIGRRMQCALPARRDRSVSTSVRSSRTRACARGGRVRVRWFRHTPVARGGGKVCAIFLFCDRRAMIVAKIKSQESGETVGTGRCLVTRLAPPRAACHRSGRAEYYFSI